MADFELTEIGQMIIDTQIYNWKWCQDCYTYHAWGSVCPRLAPIMALLEGLRDGDME